MSAVAVQSAPLGLHQPFQPRHSAAPPAALTASTASKRTAGIITLSKPISRTPPRPRKSSPGAPHVPNVSPKEKRKPRSRPTSDEDEHKLEKTPSPKPQRQPRSRQTPSPESDAPQLQKPSGRLAKQRRGTKSTPALCVAVSTPSSAPVPVPQMAKSVPHPSGLSRSAPQSTPVMSHSIPARMRRTLTGPRDDPAPKELPPSPCPRRVRQGPLTAPLGGVFPRPTHVRSPSEALFNLSLDETDDEPQDMPTLFARSRGGDKVYAGGRFQNGPDTTTLPAPSFLSGF